MTDTDRHVVKTDKQTDIHKERQTESKDSGDFVKYKKLTMV